MKIAKYKYFFLLSDLIIISTTLMITSILLSFEKNVAPQNLELYDVQYILLLVLAAGFVFIFSSNNLYKINVILVRSAHLTGVIKSVLYLLVITVILLVLLTKTKAFELLLLILNFTFCLLTVTYLLRIEILRKIYLWLKSGRFSRNDVIVGDGKAGKLLAAKLKIENPIGINVIGFIHETLNVGEEVIDGKKVLANFNNISDVVKHNKIDELLIVNEDDDYDRLLGLIRRCQSTNTQVKITSDLFKIIPQKIFTEKYANIPIIDVTPQYTKKWQLKFKRFIDLALSAAGVILLSPLFILISLLIKASSKGPIIFKQKRIGLNGSSFKFYKFRTMYVEAEKNAERQKQMLKFMKSKDIKNENTKVKVDGDITSIGRLLRKTSLDELPQLFNVIKGDMSLIGPRPCLPYEYENYDNWQKRRLSVMPGCTGVWQVWGRSAVSFNDSIVLDLYYVNNMSPWLDLQLLIKTVPVIIFGRGGG